MLVADKDLMLVRFTGTYTAANPSGVRGSKVVKPFDVKVKMHKRFLATETITGMNSLCGPFDVYYSERLKACYPEMIGLDKFQMVEATELDGSKIKNPRAMSYESLIEYVKEKEYPINIALYSASDLRHQVSLYEKDKDGQQKLQANLLQARGGKMAIENEIREMNDVFEVVGAPTELAKELLPKLEKKSGRPAKVESQPAEEESFSDLFRQPEVQPV